MIAAAPLVVSLVLGQPTDPYVRTRAKDLCPPQTDRHCLWWPAKSTVTFRQNARGNPATPDTGSGTAVFDAVTRSWQTWQGIMNDCGSLTITEGPQTDDKSIGYDSRTPSANQNIVIFRQQSCLALLALGLIPSNHTCALGSGDCGSDYDCWDHDHSAIALTTTTYDNCSGRIYDADIEMNGKLPGDTSGDCGRPGGEGCRFTLVDSPRTCQSSTDYNCVVADIQNTATHEFGHALGLDHTWYPIYDACDPGCPASFTLYTHSTMYFEARPGDLCKRCVDSGSRQFICDTYPKGKAALDCVPTKGGCSAAPAGPMIALALLAIRILAPRRDRRRR